MTRLFQNVTGLLLVGPLLALSACSGNGDSDNGITGPSYNGTETPATLNSESSQAIGISATDAVSQVVNTDTALNASPLSMASEPASTIPTADLAQLVTEITEKAVSQLPSGNLPTGIMITSDQLNQQTNSNDFCGGSISAPGNPDLTSETVDITATLNNLCFNDTTTPQTITLNGNVRLIRNPDSTSVIFSNFTLTTSIDGKTYTINNVTVNCDRNLNSCTADYEGMDGKTYRVANLAVNGNFTSGYLVNATFFHPDYGSVEVATESALFFGCVGQRQPSAGKLAFTSADNSAGSIEFLDCSNYYYCYDEDTTDTIESVCENAMW